MLHIFRAGRQIATDGRVIEFTEAHLAACAAAYDPAKHEAPIVVGHPKTDDPAYGWIRGLSFADSDLCAEAHQVNAEFAELVQKGAFKKISASFYMPECPRNPTPGAFYLRHVGFLGAQPPALKGLRTAQFADGALGQAGTEERDGIVEFADWGHETSASLWRKLRDWFIGQFGQEKADLVIPDWMIESIHEAADRKDNSVSAFADPSTHAGDDMDPKEKETLQAENARLKAELDAATKARATADAKFAEEEAKRKKAAADVAHQANVQFAEGLVKAGKVLPVHRDGLVAFMGSLASESAIEFTEGTATKSVAPADWLRGFLETLPKQVDFSERGAGRVVNREDPHAIAAAATEFAEAEAKAGRSCSIAEAVYHVTRGTAR
jgi:hypothetical protein